MTAKKWLVRGWKVNREIDALLRMKRETWDMVTAATAGGDGEPVQSTADPHSFDRYVELEDLIDARINALIDIKREIVAAVSQVPNSQYRALLIERYTEFWPWERIAADMGYSFRRVTQLHGAALRALDPIIEKIS